MNTLRTLTATLLALAAAQTASAFTYTDADLLLVFRKDGFNDVEFNLGSVSNYLGRANGTMLPVSNWDANQVRANFNNSLAGVKFVLVAATAPSAPVAQRRAWLSDANATGTPTDQPGSKVGTICSKVSDVGIKAQIRTVTNATQVYIVAPGDDSSYTASVSEGGTVDVTTLGGAAPFPVQADIPAMMRFYEIKSNTARPPALLVGSFNLTAQGALTFTAGSTVTPGPLPPPKILSITRIGGASSVSFTTTNGANYRLRYSPTASGVISNWTALATTVAGDGSPKTLNDTTADAIRFYGVEAAR